MADILKIGASGVSTMQKGLQTTSNNITNVNSEGYTRQRLVTYTNTPMLGAGKSIVERLSNEFAQAEMWRDTSDSAYYNKVYEQLYSTDQLLSGKGTSLADGISGIFSAVEYADNDPSSSAARVDLLNKLEGFSKSLSNMGSQVQQNLETVKATLDSDITETNDMLQQIYSLNQQVRKVWPNVRNTDGTAYNLVDQRDLLIEKLSKKLDIRVVDSDYGVRNINLASGQSLVLDTCAATLEQLPGLVNPEDTRMAYSFNGGTKTVLNNSTLGGEIGASLDDRTALDEALKQLGQTAVAFTDSFNHVNHCGLDLTNKAGGDIFRIQDSEAVTSSGNGTVTSHIKETYGKDVSTADLFVKFTGADKYEIYTVSQGVQSDKPVYTGTTGKDADLSDLGLGVTLSFDGTYAAGDTCFVRPARAAATTFELAATKPEDFALASFVKGSADSGNFGNADIRLAAVTNTDAKSALDTSTVPPTFRDGAPVRIQIQNDGSYGVLDKDGNLLGKAPASTNGQSVLKNALKDDGTPLFTDSASYPGYDFNITGTASAGDTFVLAINQNGFSDNTNGLNFAKLATDDTVRAGTSEGADSRMTFTERYAALVSDFGSALNTVDTSRKAADAKLEASTSNYDSNSVVSIDEEATNLVMFQQYYQASAKIITASQTVFNALIQAV